MRTLFGLVQGDLESTVYEVEAYCVVREYLVLLALEKALEQLEKLGDPEKALQQLRVILGEAKVGAESDMARFGVYLSDSAAVLVNEAEYALRESSRSSSREESKAST